MFLLEYEGKLLFREAGVRVPDSFILSREGPIEVPEDFSFPLVVKGQYLAGGRGKAGAVKVVKSLDEFRREVDKIFNLSIGGKYPSSILVESFVPHIGELYLSILVSKPDKGYILLASREGGVDVEELARKEGALMKLFIDPLTGIQPFHLRLVSKFLLGEFNKDLMTLVKNLFNLVVERDLLLAEINPLALLEDGTVVALDAKVIVDGNSEIRQDLTSYYEYKSLLTEGEKLGKKYGFSYVPLIGDVGVMGNGAGLTMATLDLVDYYGGSPACFVDVGGGASEERIRAALEVMLREIKPKAIFINIFGGITRCDDVARAIVSVIRDMNIDTGRMVIRLTGTNEDIGLEILRNIGIKVYKDMDEAAEEVVRICS
jgi:succinyl-CoA synthetase beta subunit